MSKQLLRKFFIIIGIILLFINFIMFFIDSGNIFDALLFMAFETFIDFGEIESILSILGITSLILGLTIKEDNIPHTMENNKKSIVKYNILKILGFLPFIGIICFAIYSALYGFSFFLSTSYGLEAFLGSVLIISLFIWPLYIIGIILIIKSSTKIKSLKKSEIIKRS